MNLPRGERVFTGYYDRSGNRLFILTAKEARDFYYLYAVDGDDLRKLGKSKNPLELVAKYRVMETIHGQNVSEKREMNQDKAARGAGTR